MSSPRLLLASTSPRRAELLRAAGLAFVPGTPGPEPAAGGTPRCKARARARSKALGAVLPAGGPWVVLGVDTVVDVDGTEFGKPRDRAEAEAMLRALLGRIHEVHTAHCLADPRTGTVVEELASARVIARAAGADELAAYLDGGEWRGKAGAYGIQDRTQAFLALHDGAFDTVVGLHVGAVRRLLRALPG